MFVVNITVLYILPDVESVFSKCILFKICAIVYCEWKFKC